MKVLIFSIFISVFGSWDNFDEMMSRPLKRFHGPNCWNATLYGNKMAKSIRFSSKEEFHHLMESSYCREVFIPKKGNIISYRTNLEGLTGPKSEIHAAIWLAPNLAFNKMTALSTTGFLEEAIENIDNNYGELSPIIRIKSGKTVFKCDQDPCLNKVTYRECLTLNEIEADIKTIELKQIYSKISQVEFEVAAILFGDKLPTEAFVRKQLRELNGITRELDSLKIHNELESWQLKYFKTLVISLENQLKMRQPSWLK